MITSADGLQLINGKYCRAVTLFGLSTDTKPTEEVGNGSVFIEIDTSTVYFFDSANAVWREWEG